MDCSSEKKIPLVLFLLLIVGSFGNLTLSYKQLAVSDGNLAMMRCTKNILEMQKIKNILLIGRPEYFLENDISFVSNVTVIKVYTRIGRWTNISQMFQFKWLIFILMFQRYQEIEEYFSVFQRIPNFNSRLQFIILPLRKPSQDEIKSYSRLLVSNKVINFIILVKKEATIELLTNFPYENRMCGKHSSDNDQIIAIFSEKIGFHNFTESLNEKDYHTERFHSRLFPTKVPRNMHKCTIQIVTGLWPPNVIDVHRKHYPGIEIDFVRVICKYMNLVPSYLYVNAMVGDRLPNGSWTGFMGYLQRNEADVAIGAVHIEAHRQFIFDLSDWYLYNYMLWIVPLMKSPPKSAIFEHFIFKSGGLAKLLFLSVFVSTITAMLIAARVVKSKDSRNYGRFGFVVLTIIQISLSQPRHHLPRTVQVRRIFGSWLGFCTFIIFFGQTSITSYFMSPENPVQLENIQQALKLQLAVTYDEFYDSFVIDSTQDPHITKRNEKLPVIPSLNQVAKGDAVTFIDRLRAIYITKQWLREDGSIPIRMLETDNVSRYWVQVVMTKGHYLSDWVNELVRNAWKNGFWTFMERQYIDRRTIQCSVRRQIILYNDYHRINNTKAVKRYNDAIYEAFPKGEDNEEVNRIFKPTAATERELLEMFRVNINSSITFSHLRPFFRYYLIALFCGILAFLCEILVFKLRDYLYRRSMKKNRCSEKKT